MGLMLPILVITSTLIIVVVARTEMDYSLKTVIIVGVAIAYLLSYILIYKRKCPYVKCTPPERNEDDKNIKHDEVNTKY